VYPKGSIIKLQNYRGTQYWDISSSDNSSLQLKEYEMQKEVIHSGKVRLVEKYDPKEVLSLIDWKKFVLKPNRHLRGMFRRVFKNAKEHKDYMLAVQETLKFHSGLECGVNAPDIPIKNIPLRHQALFISWSRTKRWEEDPNWGSDLGEFKDYYSVLLSDEVLAAIGTVLTGNTFYLEVVELDDRYRFILNYSEIIGNRWLFENYKGEPWNL
jgi:hypothetical protein